MDSGPIFGYTDWVKTLKVYLDSPTKERLVAYAEKNDISLSEAAKRSVIKMLDNSDRVRPRA